MMMRYDQSPEPVPAGVLQPGFESKVMHASFTIDGLRLMASDGCDDKSTLHGFQLALSVDSEASAHKYFNALADGGTIQMPLGPTFGPPASAWSPTDKYNVVWMVMVPGEQPPQ